MAQPKFFLQPLAAAICVACYSSVVVAKTDVVPTIDSSEIETLAPIVATAIKGNDANKKLKQSVNFFVNKIKIEPNLYWALLYCFPTNFRVCLCCYVAGYSFLL